MLVPGSPVPQSGQTLTIILASALLPKPYGILSVVLYLLAGLIGVPVFSDGGSGWTHFSGSTGGYLIGFLVAAVWIQVFANVKKPLFSFLHYLIAHIFILLLGWAWLSRTIGIINAWELGVNPFFNGAIAKSFLALIIVYALKISVLNKTEEYEFTSL